MNYPKRTYHCSTCGADYESASHDYDDRIVLDSPHRCPYPRYTFFERTEMEYQYKEGVLLQREVTYRKYSGHDVPKTPDSVNFVRSAEWKDISTFSA